MENLRLLHELFRACYALIKHTIGIRRGKNRVYTRIFLVVLTLFALLSLAIFLVVCELFVITLRVYLKWKEGRNFAGMMPIADCMWSKRLMHVLITVTATESYEETKMKLQPSFQNLYGSCNRLRYLMRYCAGYGYYIRNDLTLDDFITEVQCENRPFWTKDDLLDYIGSDILIPDMIKDKTWKLTTFKQPVRWTDGSNKFASILTFDHCISDGIGVMSLLKNKVADHFEILNVFAPAKFDIPAAKPLDDAYVCSGASTREHKERKGELLMTLFIEDEPKYVSMVKNLKKKLSVDFTAILIAASLVAFTEYSIKKNRPLRNLNLFYTIIPVSADILRMVEGHHSYDYNKLGNNFICGDMSLDADTTTDMLKSVTKVHRKRQEYMESSNLMLLKIMGLLPPALIRALLPTLLYGMDVGMSNVTSIVSLRAGGYELENVATFISPLDFTGLMLAVLTYDNKFHISVEAGIDVVACREDLDAIIERAFEHIELLHDELCQK